MVLLTAIILGFVLDLLFGDPRWLPHPICFIGKLISITEKCCAALPAKSRKDF